MASSSEMIQAGAMSSAYRLVVFETDPATLEKIASHLYEEGCLGLEEVEKSHRAIEVKAYFPETKSESGLKTSLARLLGKSSLITVTTIGLPAFRSFTFEPFELVPGIRVVPPPDLGGPVTEAGGSIRIRPARAFGSGRHETTRLVARVLQQHPFPGGSLLDLGTGSGILAILARQLGFANIAAVDIDDEALENARENFLENGCTDIRLEASLDRIHDTYDRITANVLTPTLLYLRESLIQKLKAGGLLILSGITLDEEASILRAYAPLPRVHRDIEGEWCCLALGNF